MAFACRSLYRVFSGHSVYRVPAKEDKCGGMFTVQGGDARNVPWSLNCFLIATLAQVSLSFVIGINIICPIMQTSVFYASPLPFPRAFNSLDEGRF